MTTLADIQRHIGVPVDGIWGPITQAAVALALGVPRAGIGHNQPVTDLTERIVLEILEHEALVLEAYRDSAKVWTWSAGLTNASGHTVFPRYKDNPQPIKRCIEVYLWALRERYLPTVLRAFTRPLAEHELGAALSFHWNTGAIGTADWVELVNEGRMDEARRSIMNWSKPKEIIARRKLERDLFFDGRWTSDGLVTVYEVSKPSYVPKWSSARQVDVRDALRELLA